MTSTLYNNMLRDAISISGFFLDQEGGKFAFSILCEMIQERLAESNIDASVIIIQKMAEVASVSLPEFWVDKIKQEQVALFFDMLIDTIET